MSALQPQKGFPVGNHLKGILGSGGARVQVDAVNASVKLLKGPSAGQNISNPPTVRAAPEHDL